MTLHERLRALHPQASRRSVKQWLEAGRVRVNGRVSRDGRLAVASSDAVALGQVAPAFPSLLRLVHEDEDLLVVDKPPGLLTIATDRERTRTAYRLLWDYLAAGRPPRRPFIVHRLDRDTSGLLVLAKSAAGKRQLQAQFEARTAERVYVAVVAGLVREEDGTLESRLAEDRSLRVRAVRSRPAGGGRPGKLAVTRYRVLARRRDASVLELTLGTGRRHQLRVQLAEWGHPILGDRLHRRGAAAGRLHLHATRLGIRHPTTGEPLRFDSAPPPGWV